VTSQNQKTHKIGKERRPGRVASDRQTFVDRRPSEVSVLCFSSSSPHDNSLGCCLWAVVGGAFLCAVQRACGTRVLGVFHSSGTVHRPLIPFATRDVVSISFVANLQCEGRAAKRGRSNATNGLIEQSPAAMRNTGVKNQRHSGNLVPVRVLLTHLHGALVARPYTEVLPAF
jgi:hypothetical protein